MLVFQHIPKTAGTTWRAIAYRQYPDGAVCPIYDEDGYYYSRAEFAALPQAHKEKFRLLIGHFDPGIRALLPRAARPRFGVFLRDAVERCISQINHIANHQVQAREVSVARLIAERTLQIDNLQVRQLCARPARFGQVSAAMVEEAAGRLERYAFVGLCHRFEESYALAVERLGWKVVPYADRNATRDKAIDLAPALSAAERRQLAELNRFDAMLLARAGRLFDARVAECKNAHAARWEKTLRRVRESRVPGGKIQYRSRGQLGRVSAQGVKGWARLRQSDEAALVQVAVGGKRVAKARATAPRPALRAKGVEPAGRCGFELKFAVPLGEADARSMRVFVHQSRQELKRKE